MTTRERASNIARLIDDAYCKSGIRPSVAVEHAITKIAALLEADRQAVLDEAAERANMLENLIVEAMLDIEATPNMERPSAKDRLARLIQDAGLSREYYLRAAIKGETK